MNTADTLAYNILVTFGPRIMEACENTIVPEELLAAFVGNECGKEWDRAKQVYKFNEHATRLEPHVLRALKAVKAGTRPNYNRTITKEDLANATAEALDALARSYGATQIMGWHMIDDLQGTIADLRDPAKHLAYAVQLLLADPRMKADIKAQRWERVFRCWNSGSPTGKTYDPNYVKHGLATLEAYRRMLTQHPPVPGPEPWHDSGQEIRKVAELPPGIMQPPPVANEIAATEPAKPLHLATVFGGVSAVVTGISSLMAANISIVAVAVIAVVALIVLWMFRRPIETALNRIIAG